MVCKACGGTVMDAQGVCVACGMPNETSADTQPSGAGVGAIPVALVSHESSSLAPSPPTDPEKEADPAATNPGSGVFCGRCGSAVDPLADFCGICGNPLREEVAERLRQERRNGTGKSPTLLDADAAETLPPVRPATHRAPWIGLLVMGIILIGIACGVLILHLR